MSATYADGTSGLPGGAAQKAAEVSADSDDPKYGGKGVERPKVYKPVKQECDGQKYIRSHIRCSHNGGQCLSFENSVEHKEIKYDRRAKKKLFCRILFEEVK